MVPQMMSSTKGGCINVADGWLGKRSCLNIITQPSVVHSWRVHSWFASINH